jgi:hypothetical protein
MVVRDSACETITSIREKLRAENATISNCVPNEA